MGYLAGINSWKRDKVEKLCHWAFVSSVSSVDGQRLYNFDVTYRWELNTILKNLQMWPHSRISLALTLNIGRNNDASFINRVFLKGPSIRHLPPFMASSMVKFDQWKIDWLQWSPKRSNEVIWGRFLVMIKRKSDPIQWFSDLTRTSEIISPSHDFFHDVNSHRFLE